MSADKEFPGYMRSATRREAETMTELLDALSRLHGGGAKMQELDLGDVVENATEAFRSGGPAIRLDRPDPQVVMVRGDRELIRLAVDNCLRNAVEATEEGNGQIGPVITWGRTDRDAWIAIQDEGIGLPHDSVNILIRHRTTKRNGRHFGLGLDIASRAVRKMGGEIRLARRMPRGTLCEIRWPQERRS